MYTHKILFTNLHKAWCGTIILLCVSFVLPESPVHCSCLHSASCLHRVPSRLEPEDSPPLHLPTLPLLGRAPQSPGGSSGAQPTLQSSVRHPATQPTGGVFQILATACSLSSAFNSLCDSPSPPNDRIPSPAQSYAVPSSRVWPTGSTPPCPGSPCSPGSTLRGALLGRATPGHTTPRCSRVSWGNGEAGEIHFRHLLNSNWINRFLSKWVIRNRAKQAAEIWRKKFDGLYAFHEYFPLWLLFFLGPSVYHLSTVSWKPNCALTFTSAPIRSALMCFHVGFVTVLTGVNESHRVLTAASLHPIDSLVTVHSAVQGSRSHRLRQHLSFNVPDNKRSPRGDEGRGWVLTKRSVPFRQRHQSLNISLSCCHARGKYFKQTCVIICDNHYCGCVFFKLLICPIYPFRYRVQSSSSRREEKKQGATEPGRSGGAEERRGVSVV